MNFGEFVRQLRIDREISLRQCCLDLEVDPSNWSKLERGLATPPKHGDILERWAAFFGLAADKRQEFFDLAVLRILRMLSESMAVPLKRGQDSWG